VRALRRRRFRNAALPDTPINANVLGSGTAVGVTNAVFEVNVSTWNCCSDNEVAAAPKSRRYSDWLEFKSHSARYSTCSPPNPPKGVRPNSIAKLGAIVPALKVSLLSKMLL